jgi:uroporphyrinogen decarboxylase
MKNQMTKKERIRATLNHQETDRLATDMWAVPEVIDKLKKHFKTKDEFDIYNHLGIDKIVAVQPKYKGPRDNLWGIEYKPIYFDGGEYLEPSLQPLAAYETIDEIEANYIWPSTDWYDYSVLEEQLEKYKDYPIEGGFIALLYFYDQIRGTEQMFLDFALNPTIADYILEKIQDFAIAHTKKILDICDGRADVSQVTDDLGSQHSLLMSEDMLRRFVHKHYENNIKTIKSYGVTVFHHSDGAMTEALPWLVDDLGIEVLNPLQWHLPGWDLEQIKKDYGDRLCFHGGVDNQHVLPFGTLGEVEVETREVIEKLYSDKRGLILAPCHNLQAITPIENIIKMYSIAKEY